MSIKKLLREGVTYNTLRKIFEECCSFLDFYETMKTYGIERKVSKIMALHFSGKGLRNEGARALSRLHEEKPTQVLSEHQENAKALEPPLDNSGQKATSKMSATSNLQEEPSKVSSEHQENGKALQCDASGHKPQPKMSATSNLQDAEPSNQVEASEDWEQEVATAAPRKSFTLKCTTSTPLSLGVEDLSFPQLDKTIVTEKPQAKIDHSHSEKDNSRNAQVTDKRPQGKAEKVEVRNQSRQLKFNMPNQSSERKGRWKKPIKENKQEGRQKKEAVSSKRGNKNEAIKTKSLKSTNTCGSEEHLDVKKGESSVSSVSLEETKPKTESGESPCEENCPSSERLLEKSRPPVILHGDMSMGESNQRFTNIFIGDIAILVPVEESVDADSNGVDLNESDSHVHDLTEEATISECSKVVDNSALHQLSLTPLEKHVHDQAEATGTKPDKVIESSQVNGELSTDKAVGCIVSSSAQSECGMSPDPAVCECEKVLDTLPLNLESSTESAIISTEQPSRSQSGQDIPPDIVNETNIQCQDEEVTVTSALDLELCSGNAMIPDQLVSSVSEEKMVESDNDNEDVTTSLAFSSNNLNEKFIDVSKSFSKGSDDVMEETDQYYYTQHVPTDVTSITDQDPMCPVYYDSRHGKSAVGGSSDMGLPWKDLQQVSSSSLPDGSLFVNQGLTSHFISTDVEQANRDLQAELSSESSSTSGEQPMDVFSRQPPLGEERGYTPDAVQQQPSQQAWLASADDGTCQMSPSIAFNNYNQTSFPSSGNPYGTFPHSQQVLPVLNPCYPSFAYPSHVRQVFPPQMMHHPQHVFMPPFSQYRNRIMFPSMVPASGSFPALPPSQFQPQMVPFLPAAAAYSSPSVPFYGTPYEQAQQASSTTVDVNSTVLMHPTNALLQVSSAVDDYQSPTMDSNGSLDSDEREDSSSELSSSDSSLELIISSTATQIYDSSILTSQESFPVQVESDTGFSASATFEDNQKKTTEEQEEKSTLSGNESKCKNDGQIFSLSYLCYKEISSDKVDTSCENRSKVLLSHQLTEGQEDRVHKQVTILSREESGIAMGRRLSPDGSSMDGICFDLPSNASSVHNNETDFKEERSSVSRRQDLAGEFCNYRPSCTKEKGKERRKDRSPSPKPQRVKGSQRRRNKNTLTSSVPTQKVFPKPANGSKRQRATPGSFPDAQSVSPKENDDSCKQEAFCSSETSQRTLKDRNDRRVRFSKEDIKHQSSESSKTSDIPRRVDASTSRQGNEKEDLTSVGAVSRLSSSGDQSIHDLERSQSKSINETVTKTTKVEGHLVHEDSRYKNSPHKHVEKRANAGMRPANIRAGNSRKRWFNDKMKRPYTEKQSVKELLDVETTETEARTDKNNNSK